MNGSSPTSGWNECAKCGRRDFHGFVCCGCGWRPDCPRCGKAVTGRVDKEHCSTKCRKAHWDHVHRPIRDADGAHRVLVGMIEEELREVLRSVFIARERREAEEQGRKVRLDGRRFRLRWGHWDGRG